MPLEVYYKMLGKVIYDTFSMVMEKKKKDELQVLKLILFYEYQCWVLSVPYLP